MNHREVHDVVYGVNFLFLACEPSEVRHCNQQLTRFFGKGNFDPIEKTDIGLCFSNQEMDKIALWVGSKRDLVHLGGTIAHEALHGAMHVFRWRNVEWSLHPGSHEAQCYYLAWVVREFLDVADPSAQKPSVKSGKTSRKSSSTAKTRKRNSQ